VGVVTFALALLAFVREQKSGARQAHEAAVDGFQLVRERIDTSDQKGEKRLALVRQTKP
jgi:hypothetical protein